MRLQIAILTGKLIAFHTRVLKIGGGSAAPGLYALKIESRLVEILSQRIPKNIIITGTNGKTTTARMIAHFAQSQGLKVIRNHTGSNLERGIASALLRSNGDYDLGIWELDEAAFNSVALKLKPDVIIFLNVFRDQLDRYGEIDTVTRNWCKTLKALPKTTKILVNSDDANTLKLKSCFKGKVETFGVENLKIHGESLEKKNLKQKSDFEAKKIKLNKLRGSSFELKIENLKLKTVLPLPGIYNIYNAVAALAATSYLNLPVHKLAKTLAHFQPAFGRFEKFTFPHSKWEANIFLIKNPAGANQVFETIVPNLKSNDRILLALNDNLADGTDVSWIWDVNFELLQNSGNLLTHIICSGTRASDLAVRLKYAGFNPKNIHIEPNLQNALKRSRIGLKGTLFILPTYTCMLEIQKILAKMKIKKNYWELD